MEKAIIFPRILSLLLVLGLLQACMASSPPATLYLLPGDGAASREGNAEIAHTLVLRPLQVAGFLNAAGIVLQLDDITLNPAANHRWAEDLGLQLQRGLRQRLANRLPDTRVLVENAGPPDALQLRVLVERFQGGPDGRALAAGQWQLREAGGALLVQAPFRVESPLTADGYPALVRALGRSWDEAADRIAEAIIDRR